MSDKSDAVEPASHNKKPWMGCDMITLKKRKLRRASESMNPYLRYATPEQRRWLKNHTLSDLQEIADSLEFQGENVKNIRSVIDDLADVAALLGVNIKSRPEHDLLEFVKAEETEATA
ncbi:MAG: hypothetical protein JSW28_09830 [Thermoplasmata archaeon]|nr:MAG: hypothetical protein JSW28_09830 [Thermoplasmata archaeon]